jgi:hypothetical protein
MSYNRAYPSPRYARLLDSYISMHKFGDRNNNISAADTFSGISLSVHKDSIKHIVDATGAKSILDYGCGKAQGYENQRLQRPDGTSANGYKQYFDIDEIGLYDPGYNPYSALPVRKFGGVICTDVLEHCPEEDIDWIISEIFNFSELFVFCTVALYPAKKTLPSGENAHITLNSIGWWIDRFETAFKAHDHRKFFFGWYEKRRRQQRFEFL